MNQRPEVGPSARAWVGVRLVAIGVSAAAITLIGLVAAGRFDPRPHGQLVEESMPGPRTLDERGSEVIRLASPWDATQPPDRFSVRLTASMTAGEIDSGYGLAIGDDRSRLVVAVSPVGNVVIREVPAGSDPEFHLPWQPWPHVRQAHETNEIWLDVEQGQDQTTIRAWVNRELLWEGETEPLTSGLALWLESFGGPVSVDFNKLEWYSPTGD